MNLLHEILETITKSNKQWINIHIIFMCWISNLILVTNFLIKIEVILLI